MTMAKAGLPGVLLATCALLAMPLRAESEACRHGPWGPDDEIGAANRITPERVQAAAQLVKRGKTQHLGIIVDADTPAFGPRSLSLQIIQPGQEWGRSPFANGFNYNDDVFQGWFGIGSQLDGLSHAGQHGVFYNCRRGVDFTRTTGVTAMGIEQVPPLVARGLVLDMTAHFGVAHLAGGQHFSVADVEAVAQAQQTPIREGDVVLFHTGWTEAKMTAEPDTWLRTEPGISEEVAHYLAERKVLAVGADTWGVDVVPPQNEGNLFAGHIILMKEHGIYLLETMNTGPLVRDRAFEFLFVLGPPRIRGSVQAMIDPIAIY